jgi:enterochelin esterase-like enzyme
LCYRMGICAVIAGREKLFNELFMKRIIHFVGFLGIICSSVLAQVNPIPKVPAGRLIRHANFPSTHVSGRHVDVWLPKQYDSTKKYAVWYVQDGQMLFDSTTTWNKQSWRAAETFQSLIDRSEIEPCIIVGIWNSGGDRHRDYFPQTPFEQLAKSVQDSLLKTKRPGGQAIFTGAPQSDLYLLFLTKELKPFIDKTYSTYPDPAHTIIMGSSMGGLISWYAVCEYPKVFGRAACLSTHWPGVFADKNNPIPGVFFEYLKKHIPNRKKHRFYFDHGTIGLDAMYGPFQKEVDTIFLQKKYGPQSYKSEVFVGTDHSERAWQKRLPDVVRFMGRI